MKRGLTILAIASNLLLSGAAYGQDPKARRLFPIVEHGKIGYIDQTGAYGIKPQFDRVLIGSNPFTDQDLRTLNFSEGFAGVKIGDKWGFIDQSGKVVIEPQFRAVWYFSEGLAQIWIADRSGYIDTAGKMVIPPKFVGYSPFSEGLASVNAGSDKKPEWGYIDKTGRFAIQPKFSFGGTFTEGLAWVHSPTVNGFIDSKGDIAIRLPDGLMSERFSEGLARVWTTPAGLIGFIDRTGRIVISPRRWIPGDFSEGLSNVCFVNGSGLNCGYIDHQGRTVIEPQYALAGPFSEGLAPVCFALRPVAKMECGYIDKTTKLVIPMRFRIAHGFRSGLALVGIGDVYPEKWGYINKTGEYVWKPTN